MNDYPPIILTDSSILFAYYSAQDNYHKSVCNFFEQCSSELITTIHCVQDFDNFIHLISFVYFVVDLGKLFLEL
jgi:hypothetical protein